MATTNKKFLLITMDDEANRDIITRLINRYQLLQDGFNIYTEKTFVINKGTNMCHAGATIDSGSTYVISALSGQIEKIVRWLESDYTPPKIKINTEDFTIDGKGNIILPAKMTKRQILDFANALTSQTVDSSEPNIVFRDPNVAP